MKTVDTGKEKINKICTLIKEETLEPAKKEAEQIIQAAKQQAALLLKEAAEEALRLKKETLQQLEKEKNVFQSSLNQACKQSLEILRESIETKLLNPELSTFLLESLQESTVVENLISAVIQAIEKEGIDADLKVLIPKSVSSKDITSFLLSKITNKLKKVAVSIGDMQGGIEVRIAENNMIIDVSDRALKDLVANYIRKDFQEILFRAT